MELEVLATLVCSYLLLVQEPHVTSANTIFTLVSCSEQLSGKARDAYCNARCKKMGYEGGTCNSERGDVCDCEGLQTSNTEVVPRTMNVTVHGSISNITKTISQTTVATASQKITIASLIYENSSYPANVKIFTPFPTNAQTITPKVLSIPALTEDYNASSVTIKEAKSLKSRSPYPSTTEATKSSSLAGSSLTFTSPQAVAGEQFSTLDDAQSTSARNMPDIMDQTYSATSTTSRPALTTASSSITYSSEVSAKSKRPSTSTSTSFMQTN